VTDRDLVSRLRGGDHDAFSEIFRQWYEPAVRSAARILRDPSIAEEISQDVVLELWRRRDAFPPDSSLGAYVLQSVRNRALNHLRHLAVQQRSVTHIEALTEPSQHADAEVQAGELEAAARDAIAALPPRTREMFVLSRERGMRYSEIAETLGVSVKAVEANMSRALRVLRERLAPWLPGAETE
jgi:RNA polymerase sigma-70 factor (ECF subfamily)